MSKKLWQAVVFVLSIGGAVAALAVSPVNVDGQGVAIQGYDPVAYFTDGKPVKGQAKYRHTVGGATYHFKNAKHRDMFAKAPGKYSPQFGGYCAMGAAMGKKLEVDPTAWKIVDGRLYLNLNKDIQKMWLDDVAGNLTIREKDPKDL